jgi:hypothetical protein
MNNVSDKLKELILSYTDTNCSILEFAYVKLYIAYNDSNKFEFTNLEGCICLVLNRNLGSLYLQLYDLINYNKDFEIQLYSNIETGYIVLNDLFHSIEFENFHLGLNFSNKIAGEKIKNLIVCNSLILNANPNLHRLNSFNELELKKQRSDRLRNNLSLEFMSSKTVVKFEVNNDENGIILIINKDEFDKSLSKIGVYANNYDSHYKKIKNTLNLKKKNEDVIIKKPERRTQYFVDYNMLKRKTEILSIDSERRIPKTSIIIDPHKSLSIYDEIKLAASRVKPVKSLEKKPLQINRLSNNPQLQMAVKQMHKNLSKEEEESD